jgi:alkaline phosphatase
MRIYLLLFLFFLPVFSSAQPNPYTTANAHSHNDYENATPFSLAFANGFGSIEADVFSINDTLFVAHNRQDIRSGRTLKTLYLDPLAKSLRSDKKRKLILLVDVKDDYNITLPLLIKELSLLRNYISDYSKMKSLTIVISGNRPPPEQYKDYPDFIFFDDDLKLLHSPEDWKRVYLVSLPFYRLSSWNGKDNISVRDSLRLKNTIDSVHRAGKPIRFWAAPDNEASWKLQMNLGVDFIGTDKINQLTDFMKRKDLLSSTGHDATIIEIF